MPASGIAAQFGIADELTYGSFIAPTRFFPIRNEEMVADRPREESEAIIAGRRVLTSDQWAVGNIVVGGPVGLELSTNGLGLLFKHMFGTVVTTGAGPTYTHTFTPGPIDGKSFTGQFGKPGSGGVVHPFSYLGCKIASWELAAETGKIATAGLVVAAREEITSQPLATATYLAGQAKPLMFHNAAVTIAGTAVKISKLRFGGDNGLKTDRFLGSQLCEEPLEEGLRTYDATLGMEFSDLTHYARFVSGTEHPLVANFTQGTAQAEVAGNVRYDGPKVKVDGKTILTHDLPVKFVASGASDASAITAKIIGANATP